MRLYSCAMTIISHWLGERFQMPEVLRVSNLRMSPSPIRTRLEAITQLVRKVFTRKLRLKSLVPDGAPEH